MGFCRDCGKSCAGAGGTRLILQEARAGEIVPSTFENIRDCFDFAFFLGPFAFPTCFVHNLRRATAFLSSSISIRLLMQHCIDLTSHRTTSLVHLPTSTGCTTMEHPGFLLWGNRPKPPLLIERASQWLSPGSKAKAIKVLRSTNADWTASDTVI